MGGWGGGEVGEKNATALTVAMSFKIQKVSRCTLARNLMAESKIKKGSFVRAVREKLENSLEAKASDSRFSPYLFETKGEVVDLRGEYALVKFGQVPTPNIWLRLDQLEEFK